MKLRMTVQGKNAETHVIDAGDAVLQFFSKTRNAPIVRNMDDVEKVEFIYTQHDLDDVNREYDKNFEHLMRLASAPLSKKKEYIERERELQKKAVKIMKALNLYIHKPCPITNFTKSCKDCTGYYKSMKDNNITIEVTEEDSRGVSCPLKVRRKKKAKVRKTEPPKWKGGYKK